MLSISVYKRSSNNSKRSKSVRNHAFDQVRYNRVQRRCPEDTSVLIFFLQMKYISQTDPVCFGDDTEGKGAEGERIRFSFDGVFICDWHSMK